MPTFKLGETPGEDSREGLVEVVILDRTSLTMAPNTSYTFETDVDPFDASDKTLAWSSSAPSVAKVDQTGTMTALSDGTAVISAVAVGGASASCTVKVASCIAPSSDYIDEYGVNHGKGIAIGDVVWAPVNCGYKAATADSKGFPYGKLYQWGRKYGQGYDSNDESYPSEDNLVEGPVMPSVGHSDDNKDKFYYNSEYPHDWSKVLSDDIWNSGTGRAPVKTEYDPCPEGWRVPTDSELMQLGHNKSSSIIVGGQRGNYFSGNYTYLDRAPQVFLPVAGQRSGEDGRVHSRGSGHFYYWSSLPFKGTPHEHWFSPTHGTYYYYYRANGYSVRCVQE